MLKKIFNENFISIVFSISAAFIIGGFVWAYVVLRSAGTSTLILHFDSVQGITMIGGPGFIVFVGAFGLLVGLMNFAIAREFTTRDRFLGKFIALMTLLFAVLLFIGFTAIINANI